MEKLFSIKNVLAAFLMAAAGLLGGWDAALQTLIAAMAVDYITGLAVAGVFKKSKKTDSGALSSRAGFRGLVQKGCVLLLVFLAVLLDRFAGTSAARPAVCWFFIANEGLSILENFGLMGLPYPKFLREMLEALNQKGDDGR